MTRKRFVKMLMARGYSRNSANFYAEAVVAGGGSYREEWQRLEVKHRAVEAITQRSVALREAVERLSTAIVKGFSAFASAIREVIG